MGDVMRRACADGLNPCSNYGYSNYSTQGLGCNRASTGTQYSGQYPPALRALYDDPTTCPQELLLFFHNLRWDWKHPEWGGRTVYEKVRADKAAALDGAQKMVDAWATLEGEVEHKTFAGVSARFAQQLNDAKVFANVLMDYYEGLYTGGS
jgi:alpha-glucuronidase